MSGAVKKPTISNRGASSVLVILIMVVLVVFGLSALTVSLASLRLTDKAGAWTEEYYSLESKAEEVISKLDKILHTAEVIAVGYIENREFLEDDGELFSEDTQRNIFLNYNHYLPENAREEYLGRVMTAAFLKTAIESIQEEFPGARIEYPGNYLRQILEDEHSGEIIFKTTVNEGVLEFSKHLDIGAKIISPRYKINLSAYSVSGMRSKAIVKRYEIIEWKEWQKIFEYSDEIHFADPN